MVSYLMPFKNSSKFIAQSIDSVLTHDTYPVELILISDNADQASLEIVRQFVTKPNVRLFQNQGRGIISALQTGTLNASGTYIGRIDSDDLLPKERTSDMVRALEQNKYDIVTGLVKYFSDADISDGYLRYENWINNITTNQKQYERIFQECVIASPAWVMKKETYLESVPKNWTYPEDYHLCLAWYYQNRKIGFVNQIVLNWREHPDRTSRNYDDYKIESFYKLKLQFFLEHEWKKRNVFVWGSGPKAKLLEALLRENKILYKSINSREKVQLLKKMNPEKDVIISVLGLEEEIKKSQEIFESNGFVNNVSYYLF